MGVDIFAYIETVRDAPPYGTHAECFAEVDLNRDSELFSLLAGVRQSLTGFTPVATPKGLPDDLSSTTRERFTYQIDDELGGGTDIDGPRYCTRAKAEEWVRAGCSRYVDARRNAVMVPSVHSASWLNADDLAEVDARYTRLTGAAHPTLGAAVAALRSLDERGGRSRLVFWFIG